MLLWCFWWSFATIGGMQEAPNTDTWDQPLHGEIARSFVFLLWIFNGWAAGAALQVNGKLQVATEGAVVG
jgi:hypothetical protein